MEMSSWHFGWPATLFLLGAVSGWLWDDVAEVPLSTVVPLMLLGDRSCPSDGCGGCEFLRRASLAFLLSS